MLTKKQIESLSPEQRQELFEKLRQKKEQGVSTNSVKKKRDKALPLSNAQQRIWLFEQFNGNSTAYNIVSATRFSKQLDVTALRWAFQQVVRRHEILRTRFEENNDAVQQVVVDQVTVDIDEIDRRDLMFSNREQLDHEITRVSEVDFKLSDLPLFKLSLLRLGDSSSVLVFVLHHILADGWSLRLLEQELSRYYVAYLQGQREPQAPCQYQYADYIDWQADWLQSAPCQKSLQYWRSTLEGAPSLLSLPTEVERDKTDSLDASSLTFSITQEKMSAFQQFCQQENVSIFMLLMAGFKVSLAQLAGVEDITLGTPIANRTRQKFENMIGLFSNTLAIRSFPRRNISFVDYLKEVKQQTLFAYNHQQLPFDQVVDAVAPERNANHSPLFQVLFALQATEDSELVLGDTTVEPLHLHRPQVEFDIMTELFFTQKSHTAVLTYRTALFDETFIRSLWDAFMTFMNGVLCDAETTIAQQWEKSAYRYNLPMRPIHPLQAPTVLDPEQTALAEGDLQLNHESLVQQLHSIVAGIHQAVATSDKPIVVVAKNQIDVYTTLLALQKTDYTHGVVDSKGVDFQAAALVDKGVRVVIFRRQQEACPDLDAYRVIPLNALKSTSPTQKNDTMEFTPLRSVCCYHNGRVVHISAKQLEKSAAYVHSNLSPHKHPLYLSCALSLDMQLSVLYVGLTQTRPIHWINPGEKLTLNHDSEATIFISAEHAVALEEAGASLNKVVVGGKNYETRGSEANGPTCYSDCELGGVFLWRDAQHNVTLRPDIRSAWVTNALGQALPHAVSGPLWLAGEGHGHIATGLWAKLCKSDNTAVEAQITNLRCTDNRNLWRFGRLCDLTALESQVTQLDYIADCYISQRSDLTGAPQLLCYVQLNHKVSEQQIRDQLSQRVSAHMVPDAFVIVSHIPLNNQGKIDTKALYSTPVLDSFISNERDASREQATLDWHVPTTEAITIAPVNRYKTDPVAEKSNAEHSTPLADAIAIGEDIKDGAIIDANLGQLLERIANNYADNTLGFISNSAAGPTVYTYKSFYETALKVAGALRAEGIKPQEILLLQLHDDENIALAFWGCILAGVIPLVASVAQDYSLEDKDAQKILAICQSVPLAAVMSDNDSFAKIQACEPINEHSNRLLDVNALTEGNPLSEAYAAAKQDTALMLFTSGSSGTPKAVMQSHEALLSRSHSEVTALAYDGSDLSFNWMPLDHVGGLVMYHLTYVYAGASQLHCATSVVLEQPLSWLRYLSDHKVTTTWAPNFAYSLINEHVENTQGTIANSEFDLTALRVILNGGEAVIAKVAARFTKNLQRFGLKPGVMMPAWGMSETCSGVLADLNYHPQTQYTGDVVHVGKPLPGVSVRIVDSENHLRQEGREGRLQVSGPMVTQGYYNNAELTQESFTDDGWFCTGDLARLDDGSLTITGREKDLIIINGLNYQCQNIEQVVDRLPQVLTSHVAACAVILPGDDSEKLAIFCTLHEGNLTEIAPLISKVVRTETGLPVSYVVSLDADDYPRTSIGKIQRRKLSAAFEAGDFSATVFALKSTETLPSWFYQQDWVHNQRDSVSRGTGTYLIVGSNPLINDDIHRLLSAYCDNVCTAHFGETYQNINEHRYDVQCDDSDSWVRLFHSVSQADNRVTIVYADPLAWTATHLDLVTLSEKSNDKYLRPLMALHTALHSQSKRGLEAELKVITRGAYCLKGDNFHQPLQSLLNGFVKSLRDELPQVGVQQIDVPEDWHTQKDRLQEELTRVIASDTVSLRENKRYTQCLRPVEQEKISGQLRHFDTQGFHLVIGGLGGIGRQLTNTLLEDEGGHVLVVGRSDPKDERRRETLEAMQNAGSRFAYRQLDICDATGLAGLITEFENHWKKPLTGLINAAGDYYSGPIHEIDSTHVLRTIRNKLAGVVAIQDALQLSKADQYNDVEQFHIGSVQAYFGGANLSLYAAANSFLSAWCDYQRAKGLPISCYQFSMWDDIGMVAGYQFKASTMAQGFHVLSAQQGVKSFFLLANTEAHQTYLIGLDASKLNMLSHIRGNYRGLRCARSPQISTAHSEDRFGTPIAHALTTQNALSDKQAGRPLNATETKIAKIWKALLKLECDVKPTDDFFELGGNSLFITRLTNGLKQVFGVDLEMQAIFQNSRLQEVAHLIEVGDKSTYPEIPRIDHGGNAVASFSQYRVWFVDKMQGESTEYNILSASELNGKLDETEFNRALQLLIQRHSILRTTYSEVAGECIQVIHPDKEVTVSITDLCHLPETEKEHAIQQYMQIELQQPFHLQEGPILRVNLLRLSDVRHVLLFSMHHIASDGWSMTILSKDFMALYQSLHSATELDLPALPITYTDYAQWQHDYQGSSLYRQDLDYWQAHLDAVPLLHSLPVDFQRRANASYHGKKIVCTLSNELTSQLKTLAQQHNVTLFMLLQSAYSVLLSRWSNSNDIVLGTPIAGRDHPDLESVVGFFVNTLVLRSHIDEQQSFAEFLADNKDVILDAFKHQRVPFDKIVDQLGIERSEYYSPLVQILFRMQNYEVSDLQLPELEIANLETPFTSVRFDLGLDVVETEDGLRLGWEYRTSLFEAETIARMSEHFERLLTGLIASPDKPLNYLPILSEAEIAQQTVAWNQTHVDYPHERCIHELFEQQVVLNPDAPAVVFEGRSLTFAELNLRANQLAHYLVAQGIKPDALVGLCLERSLEMIIGILGVMKAGGAYVPLDPNYPDARLAYMLEDSGLEIILTQKSLLSRLPLANIQAVNIDDEIWQQQLLDYPRENIATDTLGVTAKHLAYVIYTSGSTGKPKGVMIQHNNFVNLAIAFADQIGYRNQPVHWALNASFSFDASLKAITGLLFGSKVSVLSYEVQTDVSQLVNYVVSNHVDIINCTPSQLSLVLPDLSTAIKTVAATASSSAHNGHERTGPLLKIVLGGEAISPELWQSLARNKDLIQGFNTYGPTECTVDVTILAIEDASIPHLGKPIQNINLYILNDSLNPVPVGVAGELHIGGAGVARGYFNKPELTQEKFIANPFSHQAEDRIYKTGDLARWLPDGSLEYIGRVDDQVKIRGFRIELGEIEAAILDCDGVDDCSVVVRDEPARLISYLVKKGECDGNEFIENTRTALKSKLPDYMVPVVFMVLNELPLNANGKLDRKALPEPDFSQVQKSYVAPRSETEQRLCRIWCDLLTLENVGVTDNFFELGGHSLLCVKLVATIRHEFDAEVSVKTLFAHSTIHQLALEIDGAEASSIPEIKPAPKNSAALSFSQERLWFIDQMEGSTHYNMPFALRLTGKLNKQALAASLTTIVQRHESLRTVFSRSEQNADTVIEPNIQWVDQVDLPVVDLRALSPVERQQAIQERVSTHAKSPFDLSSDLMLRAEILLEDENNAVLVGAMHHIASDGWSIAVLSGELSALYEAYREGKPNPLPDLPLQYRDYAHWQRQWLQGDVLADKIDYWVDKLAGMPQVHSLPMDYTRENSQDYRGAVYHSQLNKPVIDKLNRLCQSQGATLFMGLYAVFSTLLNRYSNESDIVVGTPVANREQTELTDLIGFFVNTLLLRVDVADNPNFSDYLYQCRDVVADAYAHQQVPFEQLVEALKPDRSLSYNPLFQVMLSLKNYEQRELELGGATISQIEPNAHVSKFDLSLNALETEQGMSLFWEYSTALFKPESIERMATHFENLLTALVNNPDLPIGSAGLLGVQEQQKHLQVWNDTRTPYGEGKCIHELFESQVIRTPNATAVVFEGKTLSYQELNHQANQLAHYLREEGIKSDDLVGLCVERSLEMVIGIYAILKAGGAYVPLDPSFPESRLAYMLEDSKVSLLLTQQKLASTLPLTGQKTVILDCASQQREFTHFSTTNIAVETIGLSSEHLAYVIYTSGSTGQPKGVMCVHNGLVNRVEWMAAEYDIDAGDTILQKTPFTFDVSVWEFTLPLIKGGCLVVAKPQGHKDPAYLKQIIQDNKVTALHFVPSMLTQMLSLVDWSDCHSVNHVFCSGEALPMSLQRQFFATGTASNLHNLYGPTEAAIDVSYWKCENNTVLSHVPIGRPISNIQLLVLDPELNIVPTGVVGELHIGGVGLARGYLNKPELTQEMFIDNPFAHDLPVQKTNNRLYKTGDLVRWSKDGSLEYVGRIDHQVKVRGFRIELGEVEVALTDCEGVEECVVVAQGEPKRLVAYIVASHSDIVQGLTSRLQSKLPEYMVPSIFVRLEHLPLSANGKIDRHALPDPDISQHQREYVAPSTATEHNLCDILANVLDIDKIGVTDNIFSLGMHSLLIMRFFADIEKALGVLLEIRSLFERPTIQDLAIHIDLESVLNEQPTESSIEQEEEWIL